MLKSIEDHAIIDSILRNLWKS